MDLAPLITVEGIHGAGKSLVASRVLSFLGAQGRSAILASAEHGTTIANQLRAIRLDGIESVDAYTETLLVAAARRESVVAIIAPALRRGTVVIAERFSDAFYAFGAARSLPFELTDVLSRYVTDEIVPQLTILLDLDPHVALGRIPTDERHRVERESIDFHQRLREGYLARARADVDRIVVLDASAEEGVVCQQAIDLVTRRLAAEVFE